MNIADQENAIDTITLSEFIAKVEIIWRYILSKWRLVLIAAIIGVILGFIYGLNKPSIYTATSTFVLDGSKGGGGSQFSGLAALAGIDIGGTAGGIFQGDNIIELYRSRLMIEKTLLTKVNIDGKDQMLIDRYVDFNNLRKGWRNNEHIGSIKFNGDPEKFDRKQDSIITDLIAFFNKKVLVISKLDRKLDIMQVDVTTNDELFSKEFNNKLVQTVNDFYTFTKTKNSYKNVQILQKQVDSVKELLNSSISGVAAAIDASPNANPNIISLHVSSQKQQVDVQANSAIYSEIVKNLEVSKMSLLQETPLIQMIDKPVLPLPVKKWQAWKGITAFAFLGIFLALIIIIIRYFYAGIAK